MSNETSTDYQAGYRAAMENAKSDLAAQLRILAEAGLDGEGDEKLGNQMLRTIFTGAFDVMAADEEFGPRRDVLSGPVRGRVRQPPLVDAGAGQQVLHPVRARVAGSLGQRPAVVILQLRQQAVHHVTAGQTGFPPGGARCDPGHRVIEQSRVRGMIYAGSSGCRVVVLFHKLA